jgi:secreted trypsin-like serine protease
MIHSVPVTRMFAASAACAALFASAGIAAAQSAATAQPPAAVQAAPAPGDPSIDPKAMFRQFPIAKAQEEAARKGKPGGADKIILGVPAPKGAYPFQVGVFYSPPAKPGQQGGSFYICGGSLVDDDWVLTAAHCITDAEGNVVSPGEVEIFAGSNDFRKGDRIKVAGVFRHPSYNEKGMTDNDVALLKLQRQVRSGPGVATIRLPESAVKQVVERPGLQMGIAGWGKTETGQISQVLMEQRVTLVDNQACARGIATVRATNLLVAGGVARQLVQDFRMTEAQLVAVRNAIAANAGPIVDDGMICAGDPAPKPGAEKVADTCQGDSGGPMFVKMQDNSFVQVGIVSWGDGCGIPRTYGVYARVSAYMDWIRKTMAD